MMVRLVFESCIKSEIAKTLSVPSEIALLKHYRRRWQRNKKSEGSPLQVEVFNKVYSNSMHPFLSSNENE